MMLMKSLNSNADEDQSGTVTVGDTLTYRFIAVNNGDVVLTNVSHQRSIARSECINLRSYPTGNPGSGRHSELHGDLCGDSSR